MLQFKDETMVQDVSYTQKYIWYWKGLLSDHKKISREHTNLRESHKVVIYT